MHGPLNGNSFSELGTHGKTGQYFTNSTITYILQQQHLFVLPVCRNLSRSCFGTWTDWIWNVNVECGMLIPFGASWMWDVDVGCGM